MTFGSGADFPRFFVRRDERRETQGGRQVRKEPGKIEKLELPCLNTAEPGRASRYLLHAVPTRDIIKFTMYVNIGVVLKPVLKPETLALILIVF